MKFLETITTFGNDVLVPIDRIKHINFLAKDSGFEIIITSDDGEWCECFTPKGEEKANQRYEIIKKLIDANQ